MMQEIDGGFVEWATDGRSGDVTLDGLGRVGAVWQTQEGWCATHWGSQWAGRWFTKDEAVAWVLEQERSYRRAP